MTEQEYIDAGDLARLRTVEDTLRDIVPSNSSVVDETDYRYVRQLVGIWVKSLFKKMDIEQEEAEVNNGG